MKNYYAEDGFAFLDFIVSASIMHTFYRKFESVKFHGSIDLTPLEF